MTALNAKVWFANMIKPYLGAIKAGTAATPKALQADDAGRYVYLEYAGKVARYDVQTGIKVWASGLWADRATLTYG